MAAYFPISGRGLGIPKSGAPHRRIADGDTPPGAPVLRRVLTVWPLIFYGLEVIVGAGIYVAIGAVMDRAAAAAPLAFLLAGIAAAATGLCYAELAGRFPEASGAVSYVRHGFGSDRLAQLTGLLMILSVAVAAASIVQGAVHYLTVLVPLPAAALIVFQVTVFTAIAAFGVRTSVWLAAALGVVEIAGLVAATIAGLWTAPEFHITGMIPANSGGVARRVGRRLYRLLRLHRL